MLCWVIVFFHLQTLCSTDCVYFYQPHHSYCDNKNACLFTLYSFLNILCCSFNFDQEFYHLLGVNQYGQPKTSHLKSKIRLMRGLVISMSPCAHESCTPRAELQRRKSAMQIKSYPKFSASNTRTISQTKRSAAGSNKQIISNRLTMIRKRKLYSHVEMLLGLSYHRNKITYRFQISHLINKTQRCRRLPCFVN